MQAAQASSTTTPGRRNSENSASERETTVQLGIEWDALDEPLHFLEDFIEELSASSFFYLFYTPILKFCLLFIQLGCSLRKCRAPQPHFLHINVNCLQCYNMLVADVISLVLVMVDQIAITVVNVYRSYNYQCWLVLLVLKIQV